MRRDSKALLILALALGLAGCSLRGKPKAANPAPPVSRTATAPPAAPPPPPEPLSIPQTQVQLPPPQPLDPEALATAEPQQQPVEPASPPRPARRAPAPVASTQTKPESPPAAAPPVPIVEPRPTVQPIVPAEEQKRLLDSSQARKREVRYTLGLLQGKRLNRRESDLQKRIEFFLNQSDQAEQRGDMRQADAFAERAQALAREWQGGR